MITIACVLKTGGDFDQTYVERLATGVHRSLTLPHRFVCLSDVPHKIGMDLNSHVDQMILLRHDWPGWWAKMEAFSLPGPVLYLDLDTVLVGPIDRLAQWILESKDCLLMLRDFYTNRRSSGILGWNGDLQWIQDGFVEQCTSGSEWHRRFGAIQLITAQARFRGDQDWLRYFLSRRRLPVVFAQDVASGIYSYKVHVSDKPWPPADASIICFHGRPRIHQVSHLPWVQKFWGDTK